MSPNKVVENREKNPKRTKKIFDGDSEQYDSADEVYVPKYDDWDTAYPGFHSFARKNNREHPVFVPPPAKPPKPKKKSVDEEDSKSND